MTKSTVILSLLLTCLTSAGGQEAKSRASGTVNSETSTSANTGSIELANATRISAELQKVLDVRKAKIGDELVLKTTHAIKSDGRVVVGKGARLFGRVTEVARNSEDGTWRIGLLFHRLEHGKLSTPITASIRSITSATTSASLQSDDSFGGSSASSRSTASANSATSAGSGGLISSTTAILGSTVNSTTNAVGNTTSEVVKSPGRIQILQSSNSSVQGESVLSLEGENVRLEKGSRFNLLVNQSAKAQADPKD